MGIFVILRYYIGVFRIFTLVLRNSRTPLVKNLSGNAHFSLVRKPRHLASVSKLCLIQRKFISNSYTDFLAEQHFMPTGYSFNGLFLSFLLVSLVVTNTNPAIKRSTIK